MSDSVNLSKISNEFSKGSNGKTLNLDLLNISNKSEKLNKSKVDVKSPDKKNAKKDSLLNLAIGMSEGLYQGTKGMVVGTLDIGGNVDQKSIDQIAKYGNSNDLSVGTSISHTAGGVAHSINLIYHDPHLIAQAFHQVENNLFNGSNLQRGRTLGNIFVFVASTGIGLGGIGKATQIASDVREADLATQGIRAVADANKALTDVNMALAKSTDFLTNTSIDASTLGTDSGLRILTDKLGSDPTSFLSSVSNNGLKIEDASAKLLPNLRPVASSANEVLFNESEATGIVRVDQTGFKNLTTASDQVTGATPLNPLASDIPASSLDRAAAVNPAATVVRPLASDIPVNPLTNDIPPVSLDGAALDPSATVVKPLASDIPVNPVTSDIPPVSLDSASAVNPSATVVRPLASDIPVNPVTNDIPPVSLDSASAVNPSATVVKPLASDIPVNPVTSDIPPVSLDGASAVNPAATVVRPLASDIPVNPLAGGMSLVTGFTGISLANGLTTVADGSRAALSKETGGMSLVTGFTGISRAKGLTAVADGSRAALSKETGGMSLVTGFTRLMLL